MSAQGELHSCCLFLHLLLVQVWTAKEKNWEIHGYERSEAKGFFFLFFFFHFSSVAHFCVYYQKHWHFLLDRSIYDHFSSFLFFYYFTFHNTTTQKTTAIDKNKCRETDGPIVVFDEHVNKCRMNAHNSHRDRRSVNCAIFLSANNRRDYGLVFLFLFCIFRSVIMNERTGRAEWGRGEKVCL